VSLSADKHAAVAIFGTMPERLFPVFGKDADEEKKDIKSSYPSFIEGKRQLITENTRYVYQYWQSLLSYAEDQKALASNLVRYELGDAEYGTTPAGLVIVSRRIKWYSEAKPAKAGFRDGIYPENS
jgi:hypothetical protein